MCVREIGEVGKGHDILEITAYLVQLGFLFATNKPGEFWSCCDL